MQTSSRFSAPTRCHALIPCAGSGARLPGDAPKQYRRLLGDCVVQHTVRAFLRTPRIASVAVVVQADDTLAVACLQADPRLSILPLGGASRARSVLGGLDGLLQRGAAPSDWALVHDAARCCITPELIDRLIDACLPDAVGGLLALPLPDTLKAADASGLRVVRTEPREGRWLAQTPQMFRIGTLREALQAAIAADASPPPGSEREQAWGQHAPPPGRPKAGAAPSGGSEREQAWGQHPPPTDEAGAMERLGAQPLLVPGAAFNFKITYPQDLELAQALLAARSGEPA
ncbi:MAG: 2-C-methyl-D-erythritol 4-phosphate cytidylyltransferase [Thiomonas sp. 20-64-5]|nr:MAG: 2-C-methyl-D-erythritol 4-phosphate cytidylyltransferase [Thiomonas sp. 20-64-5]